MQRWFWLVLGFLVSLLFIGWLGDFVYDLLKALFDDPALKVAAFLKAHWRLGLTVLGLVLSLFVGRTMHQRRRQREEDQARKRRERAARVRQEWVQLHQTFELFKPAPMLAPNKPLKAQVLQDILVLLQIGGFSFRYLHGQRRWQIELVAQVIDNVR